MEILTLGKGTVECTGVVSPFTLKCFSGSV